MKTSNLKLLCLFFALLMITIGMNAQHTEIEHLSAANDPQLQLTQKNGGSQFTRLTFANENPGHWTIATSNSTGTFDNFNIFYDDGVTPGLNVINIDGDANVTNFNTAIEVLDKDITIRGTDPDLILSSDGTNDPAILFGDNGGSGDARIWYDSSEDFLNIGTSTLNPDMAITGSGKVSINETNDIQSQLTVKANAGNTTTPAHIDLFENNNSGYGVLRYRNFSSGITPGVINGSFTAEANGVYANGISGAADYRIRYSEDNTEAGKKDILSAVYAYRDHDGSIAASSQDERVGIRTGDPLTDLHLIHKSGTEGHGFRIENEVGSSWWKMYTSQGGSLQLRNNTGAGVVGTFATNGAYTASDLRLKRDIENAPYGLSELLKMEAKIYHYKTDKKDAKKSIGFIAQEINEISPELVMYDSEADQYSLNYAAINVIAVQAIQDQQKIIDNNINEIELMKKEMASLKAIVKALTPKKQ